MLRQMSLFSQVLSLFDRTRFARLVREQGAEYGAKGFSCWDQFVAMLFCQLAQARSLREIGDGLGACVGKLQHLGLESAPARSTLAYANAHRPWQLFEALFYDLLAQCRQIAPAKPFRFKNKLLSLDATVIELCASMFDWARFRKTKGAVKVHLLLDHDGCLPVWALITEGREHEIRSARLLRLPAGSVVMMDRGYCDFDLFRAWDAAGVWFVTRAKANLAYQVEADWTPPDHATVRKDCVIRLTGAAGADMLLRMVVLYDAEKQEEIVLLSNHMKFSPRTIAAIYRQRWQIELFFKAIKQNLRIKTFVGTSANALHVQIWTALIAVLLLKYMQFRSRLGWSFSRLVALIRWNLFTYRELWTWLNDPFERPAEPPDPSQPLLPLFVLDSIHGENA